MTGSIGTLTVAQLLNSIGSDAVSPGAGSAAAVVLALATGCARKAAAISLRHRPAVAFLQEAAQRCEELGLEALTGADEDARGFATLVAAHDKAESAAQLVAVGCRIERLAGQLLAIASQLQPLVTTNVAGDLAACEALARAALAIEQSNIRDNQRAAAAAPDATAAVVRAKIQGPVRPR